MLSKLAYNYGKEFENKVIENCHKENSISFMKYYTTYKNSKNLSRLKLPELKEIAKHLEISHYCKKAILIERIEDYFRRSILCEKIQKIFRGSLVRRSMKLRGPALKNRGLCVNDTDFITLEPIHEIPLIEFYSYQIDTVIYGCSILSLAEYIKKNGVKNQPYNRSPFPDNVIEDFTVIYQLTNILYKSHRNVIKGDLLDTREPLNIQQQLQNKLQEIRSKPITIRIQELFMEIDYLGNYTNSTWFTQLTVDQFIYFYRKLFSIWSRLSDDIKRKIFILGHPFTGYQRDDASFRNINYIQEACLFVIENFVYGGVDIEFRKIGILHVLSALTVVSIGARTSMFWLYESVI